MNPKVVYQPIYEDREPYEGSIFPSDVVYVRKSDAIAEINSHGYTEAEEERSFIRKEKGTIMIYKRPQSDEDSDDYYRKNDVAYIKAIEVK